MSRGNWLLAAALAVFWLAGASAPEGRPVKVLARGPWPHLPLYNPAGKSTTREPETWVIRTPAELARAAGGRGALVTVPKAFEREAIDFEKQMVLAVEDRGQPLVGSSTGGPPSALYSVSIVRIELDEPRRSMTVFWRRVPRGKDQGILSHPLEAVLVERFDGEVKFERLASTDGPAEPPPPATGNGVAPMARAFWPDGWPPEAQPQEWFIRDYKALIPPNLRAPEPVLERLRREAKARYLKALGVDEIDFTTRMIVGVSAGAQPAGTKVEVTRVELDETGRTMTVHWMLRAPERPRLPEGLTHPAEVLLLERFAGDIRFQQG